MDASGIRDALAAANYQMALTISLSRVGGPWLENLLKPPPSDLRELVSRTFELYTAASNASGGRVYNWVGTFSQTFFWRFLGAWQFGVFTPLVERSVTALRAYENATISPDIFYRDMGVNKCTTPVHLFDEKERRRMWLELYENVLTKVSGKKPEILDARLTNDEIGAMVAEFKASGPALVKKWVKAQGSCTRR